MKISEEFQGKIIDAHTHIFPDKIAEKATQAVGDFYDLPMDGVGTKDHLIDDMSKYGINHCFIHSVATFAHQVRGINDFLINVIKSNGDKFTAFGPIHVDVESITDELDYMRANGITGVKLHNDFQGFAVDDPRLDVLYEKCQAEKIPIMFHAGDKRYHFTNPKQFRNVGRKFPNLIGIAAHFGGYSEWVDVDDDYCKDSPFWFDTSSSLFLLNREDALKIINIRGSDKIMFGTDFPMWTACDEYERIEELGLDGKTVENIMYKNAENFLKTVSGN